MRGCDRWTRTSGWPNASRSTGPHLRSVAYRMLGSLTEADDAVQDAWLRVSRAGADDVENLGGWLTTIVARVCLNMLRSRNVRREESFGVRLPDPIVSPDGQLQPEDEAVLADSVGLALLVVLDTLTPAERLAFVLHDMFELPFEEIAPMVGRLPTAARQLASRARRRVKGADIPAPDPDLARQREVVDAFFLAARGRRLRSARRACSTRTSCCAPTSAPGARPPPGWFAAQRPWPGRRSRPLHRRRRPAPRAGERRSWRGRHRGDGRSPSWASPSPRARSWRSTPSPIPNASTGSPPPSSAPTRPDLRTIGLAGLGQDTARSSCGFQMTSHRCPSGSRK